MKLTIKANQVKCRFLRKGETGVPGENLSVQSREPTNSTHISRRVEKSNPGHIGGRRLLSPLGHPCPLNLNKTFSSKFFMLFLVHNLVELFESYKHLFQIAKKISFIGFCHGNLCGS